MKEHEKHAFKKNELSQLNFFVKYVESSTSIWTITLNFFLRLVYALLVSLWTSFRQAGAIEECIFFPICFVFAKSDSLEQEREKVIKEHSVLEQIWIKGSYSKASLVSYPYKR